MFRAFVLWVMIFVCIFFGFRILFWSASHIELYEFTELTPGRYIVTSVDINHSGQAVLERPMVIGECPIFLVKHIPKSILVVGTQVNITK